MITLQRDQAASVAPTTDIAERKSTKVQTSFGLFEIAHIDDAIDFSQKYDWKGECEKWLITGGAEDYEVDLIKQSCTCPDFFYRRQPCKHLRNLNFLLVHGML